MTTTSRSAPGWRRWGCLLAAAAGGTAWLLSSTPEPPEPRFSKSLVELLPLGRLTLDTMEIDFGAPLERGMLGEGWGPDHTGPSGAGGNWATARTATLRFPLMRRHARIFALYAGGLPAGEPPQVVTVLLNGLELSRVQLPPEVAKHVFPAPRTMLREGWNELRFEFSRQSTRPETPGLAAFFDKLEIHDETWPPSGPTQRRTREDFRGAEAWHDGRRTLTLEQPASTRVDWSFLPLRGAELRFGRGVLRGCGNARAATATVRVCRDRAEEPCRLAASFRVYAGPPDAWVQERLPIPELESDAVRLELSVETPDDSRALKAVGQVWADPRLVYEEAPQPLGQPEGPIAAAAREQRTLEDRGRRDPDGSKPGSEAPTTSTPAAEPVRAQATGRD